LKTLSKELEMLFKAKDKSNSGIISFGDYRKIMVYYESKINYEIDEFISYYMKRNSPIDLGFDEFNYRVNSCNKKRFF